MLEKFREIAHSIKGDQNYSIYSALKKHTKKEAYKERSIQRKKHCRNTLATHTQERERKRVSLFAVYVRTRKVNTNSAPFLGLSYNNGGSNKQWTL